MSVKLMPYGSTGNSALLVKAGRPTGKQPATFGSSQPAELLVKAGPGGGKQTDSLKLAGKVVRLNSRKA